MLVKKDTNLFPDFPEKTELLRLLGQRADLIEKVAKFADKMMLWLEDKMPLDHHFLSALMLYRHTVELLYAVSVLVRQSSIDPAYVLLRSILESFWQLVYLLQKDCDRRGMAFVVCALHNEINGLEALDTTTQRGKNAKGMREKDRLLCGAPFPVASKVQDEIKERKKYLALPGYANAEQEYKRVKQNVRGLLKWYQLFGGPKNIEQLAVRLKYPAGYENFYRYWSGKAHGSDVIDNLIHDDGSGIAYLPINLPTNATDVFLHAVSLGVQLHKTFISGLMPNREQEFSLWYEREIMAPYKLLRKMNFSVKLDSTNGENGDE